MTSEQYRLQPRQIERGIEAVGLAISKISQGSRVAVEGTPLYLGQEWDSNCNVGFNYLLPALKERLGWERECHTKHFVLLDDFSTNTLNADTSLLNGNRQLLSPMVVPADVIFLESEFVEPAVEAIQRFSEMSFTLQTPQGLLLSANGQRPKLTTQYGNPSCELLDAHFQMQKQCDTAVIIHPSSFETQQREMRIILREINDGNLPFEVINIFFKNHSISKVIHTQKNGKSEQLI